MHAQQVERRLNAQMLDRELDDALESFEGNHGLSGAALAAARDSGRRAATGPARERDRKDRATYQTVLDPRTRLVRAAGPLGRCGSPVCLHGGILPGKECCSMQYDAFDWFHSEIAGGCLGQGMLY